MNKMTTTTPAEPGANMKNTDTTEWSKFMTDDEYYPFLVKKNIRPAIWRWRDLKPRLNDVAQDPLRRADRRFIALVNSDTGEAGGVLPSIFLGIQIINPSEHIVPHRFAYYFVCPEDYATFPKVAALREWLMEQGRESARPPVPAAQPAPKVAPAKRKR